MPPTITTITTVTSAGGKSKAVGGAVFFACLGVVAESVFDLVGTSADEYRHRRALARLDQPAAGSGGGAEK